MLRAALLVRAALKLSPVAASTPDALTGALRAPLTGRQAHIDFQGLPQPCLQVVVCRRACDYSAAGALPTFR